MMTHYSFPAAGIKLPGKSGCDVPASHSRAGTILIPDFLFGESLRTCLEKLQNKTRLQWWFRQCLCPTEPRQKIISRLSCSSTEVNRKPPMLRFLIPGCTADKFWHFSSISETHNTHHSLVRGLQGYSLFFGINQLFCSTVRKQFSSWLVAVWGKKCLFQLIWVPGSAF